MKVYLTRHGLTAGNAAKQYIGAGTDIPLSREGIALLKKQPPRTAERVYTSDMLRARQTAEILYPAAQRLEYPELREMHFGSFEGKNWQQLQHDADYSAWLQSACMGRCPGGEDREEFIARTSKAFLDIAANDSSGELHMVVHGGSIMALLSSFAGLDYFTKTPPGGCWVCRFDGGKYLEVLRRPEGEA